MLSLMRRTRAPTRTESPAEQNERLLREDPHPGFFGCSIATAEQLLEHPVIRCHAHPDRPGVWRLGEGYTNWPQCRSCMVEDPYV
jgi:hypothetical protein